MLNLLVGDDDYVAFAVVVVIIITLRVINVTTSIQLIVYLLYCSHVEYYPRDVLLVHSAFSSSSSSSVSTS